MRRAATTLAALVWLAASPAGAQTLELARPSAWDPEIRAAVEPVLASGRRVWVTRDTVWGPADTVDAHVVVVRATLKTAGTVRGRILAVESEVFVRPGARIEDGVVVLNGGYYGTQLARVGPVWHRPIDAYRVQREAGGRGVVYRIHPPPGPSALRLHGLHGFEAPAYDRVNALTVRWGASVVPSPGRILPSVRARLRYRSARERWDGDLRLRWAAGPVTATVEGGRTTATEDAWIHGELENTLGAFLFAADHRNYRDATFARADLALRRPDGRGPRASLTLEWEEARSLRNRDPFSLAETEGGFRPNPPVDDGRNAALRVGVAAAHADRATRVDAHAFWEIADKRVAGTFTYARAGAAVEARGALPWGHRWRVRARAGTSLGGRVPAQRWAALGGYKTLPTLPALSLRGPTYAFLQTTYGIPFLRSGLGDAVLWVQHAMGAAGTGRLPRMTHNLGLGADVGPLGIWLFADPRARGGDLTFGFGLAQL